MSRPMYYKAGSPEFAEMGARSEKTRRLTAELNTGFHAQDEIVRIMKEITGRDVPSDLRVFTPFYSDYGYGLTIGKNVFINVGCCFQDQGGITIGDNVQIGHYCVFATINHGKLPENRGDCDCRP
ncbi:MAG: sugar O-acetyltransferase, partial [archaeon]|nr:sugar O-acetyltransferase [archaeon]